MALVSRGNSTLNPNAPMFIPAVYRQVEDFSPEWWQLVTTTAWYQDYWTSQHQGEDGFYDETKVVVDDDDVLVGNDIAEWISDSFDLGHDEEDLEFEEFIQSREMETRLAPSNGGFEKDGMKNLSLLQSGPPRHSSEPAKYAQKPAKNMNPKSSPRCIHQPR